MVFNRLCTLTSVVAILLSTRGLSAELSGRVVQIVDGDTITVLDSTKTQHRIRLLGIDAPEQKQDFGSASKRELSKLLAGKKVRIYFKKYDRYGRILGKVMLNKTDAGLNQIKTGMAWHYKYFKIDQNPKDHEYYSKVELEARTKKRGLWIQANPLEPSDFRKLSRNNLLEKNKF